MSEAKCEPGWGDLSTRALLDAERLSPHPVDETPKLYLHTPASASQAKADR
jgi:hypothetical protein